MTPGRHTPMPVIETRLDLRDATFAKNRDAMAKLVADLRAKVAKVELGGGDHAVVHPVCGELRKFEERRTGIDQRTDAIARQQLAARDVLCACGGPSALLDRRDLRPQIRDQRGHRFAGRRERRVTGVELRFESGHRAGSGVSSARASRAAPQAARKARRSCR